MDKKYTLVEMAPEEGKNALAKFEAFLDENMLAIQVSQNISPQGTIVAHPVLMKKVELVVKPQIAESEPIKPE